MRWVKTKDRFVAYFDILGFKNQVNDNHNKALTSLQHLSDFRDIFSNNKTTLSPITGSVIVIDKTIKGVFFSDSIVFVSIDDSQLSAIQILSISQAFISSCMNEKIPIKGCISFGKFTADFKKSIFVGTPLINAFLLEEELELIACIVDNHFEKQTQYIPSISSFLVNYKTPLKSGYINHSLVNWIDIYISKDSLDKTMSSMYLNVSGKPRRYLDNT